MNCEPHRSGAALTELRAKMGHGQPTWNQTDVDGRVAKETAREGSEHPQVRGATRRSQSLRIRIHTGPDTEAQEPSTRCGS